MGEGREGGRIGGRARNQRYTSEVDVRRTKPPPYRDTPVDPRVERICAEFSSNAAQVVVWIQPKICFRLGIVAQAIRLVFLRIACHGNTRG